MEKYQEKVYKLLAKIPKGKVVTYGQIAKKLHIKSARLVGRILHVNKDPVKFPCYKVVFADGQLTPSYGHGGIKEQISKLKKDGVFFKNEKVDLTKSGYEFLT